MAEISRGPRDSDALTLITTVSGHGRGQVVCMCVVLRRDAGMLGDHSELMYTPDDFLVTIAMSNNEYEEFGLNRAISTAKNPRHVSQVICHSFYDRLWFLLLYGRPVAAG